MPSQAAKLKPEALDNRLMPIPTKRENIPETHSKDTDKKQSDERFGRRLD
jgi:ribosomal protein S10